MIEEMVDSYLRWSCCDIADKLSNKNINEIVVILPSGLVIGQCLSEIMGLPVGAWIPETNAFITSQTIPTNVLFVDFNKLSKLSEIRKFFSLAYPAMDWLYVKVQYGRYFAFNVEIIHRDDIHSFEEDYDMDSLTGGME